MNTITPTVSHAHNNNDSRNTLAARYEDVLEEQWIPKATTIETAHRNFLRQMSNDRIILLRRAMINKKRSGRLFN